MRFNKITYGILSACGLAMTLTACQNEADLETTASGNYISVPVSTVITVPDDAETRTTLNEVAGNLQWEWEEGDQVLVIDRMTGARGYLTAGEPTQNGKTAPFSGSVDFKAGATSAKLSIFYVGKGVDPTSIVSEIKIDLENQDGKSESLVKRDVLWTGLTESTAVDVVINPTHTVINDFELKHMTSAGRFQLKIKDGEPINNTAVTITKASEGTLISPFSCKIIQQSTGEVSLSEDGTEDGSITTTTDATGEFYITMMPNPKMSMKFVTTYNGKTYTGYLGGSEDFSFSLSPGQYLRSNNYGPLVIEMEADEPEETVDHSLNPLLKWAETNLERVSDSQYYKGIFADSYKDNGYYYQFGRNVGFVDYNEANDCAFVYKSTGYDSNQTISCGDGNGSYYHPNQSFYTISNLKNDNMPMAYCIPCYSGAKDWWPSQSENTQTWDERATASGYTPSDLYTINGVKWKIPSASDFETILPSEAISTSFTVVTEAKELTTGSGDWVGFRWKKVLDDGSYYLEIKAKMISNSAALSSINWDDSNDKDIVTRYFKASGMIYPNYFAEGVYYKVNYYTGDIDYVWASENHNGYDYAGIMEAAKAIPFGNMSYKMTEVSAGYTEDEIDVNLWVPDNQNFNKYIGRYWTSDNTRKVMQFIFDGTSGKSLGGDKLGLSNSNASACSLRLIKAE